MSRPNVSEGYKVPTELPGSTGFYSGFVFIAYVMYIITTLFDGVLRCFWVVFTVFLVSLHGE